MCAPRRVTRATSSRHPQAQGLKAHVRDEVQRFDVGHVTEATITPGAHNSLTVCEFVELPHPVGRPAHGVKVGTVEPSRVGCYEPKQVDDRQRAEACEARERLTLAQRLVVVGLVGCRWVEHEPQQRWTARPPAPERVAVAPALAELCPATNTFRHARNLRVRYAETARRRTACRTCQQKTPGRPSTRPLASRGTPRAHVQAHRCARSHAE